MTALPDAIQVFEYIREHPGTTLREIVNDTGVRERRVRRVMDNFRRRGLIVARTLLLQGKRTWLWSVTAGATVEAVHQTHGKRGAWKVAIQARSYDSLYDVYDTIVQMGAATRSEIVEDTGRTYKTVSRVLERLKAFGVIETSGKPRKWRATGQGFPASASCRVCDEDEPRTFIHTYACLRCVNREAE